MSIYTFFSKDPKQWSEAFQSLWRCHNICLTLEHFHTASITQSELSSLTSLKAWGDPEKFKSDVAFLLILTGECTVGDKVFGLSTMWVHPYQARAPTMEEAVKQLTPYSPLGLIGPMPWCGSMGMSATCHSLSRGTWASWWKGALAVPPTGGSAN